MITKLAILALFTTQNHLAIQPQYPLQRPSEISTSTAPKAIKPLTYKIPEEIKPLEYIGPTVDGSGNPNNTYDWGNCTWYVASNRAIPEDWGNASTWLYQAQAEGYRTGTTPQVGAVVWFPPGASWGHVALVKAINADGTIIISEMNVVGLGMVSERVINANEVEYIY